MNIREQYPTMVPYVGERFRSPGALAILLVGESHYLPDGSVQHCTPDSWYSGSAKRFSRRSSRTCWSSYPGWLGIIGSHRTTSTFGQRRRLIRHRRGGTAERRSTGIGLVERSSATSWPGIGRREGSRRSMRPGAGGWRRPWCAKEATSHPGAGRRPRPSPARARRPGVRDRL
jgi:hypothetical protein